MEKVTSAARIVDFLKKGWILVEESKAGHKATYLKGRKSTIAASNTAILKLVKLGVITSIRGDRGEKIYELTSGAVSRTKMATREIEIGERVPVSIVLEDIRSDIMLLTEIERRGSGAMESVRSLAKREQEIERAIARSSRMASLKRARKEYEMMEESRRMEVLRKKDPIAFLAEKSSMDNETEDWILRGKIRDISDIFRISVGDVRAYRRLVTGKKPSKVTRASVTSREPAVSTPGASVTPAPAVLEETSDERNTRLAKERKQLERKRKKAENKARKDLEFDISEGASEQVERIQAIVKRKNPYMPDQEVDNLTYRLAIQEDAVRRQALEKELERRRKAEKKARREELALERDEIARKKTGKKGRTKHY